jgi:sugar-specific transcriptional regulator TrmB
MDVVTANVTLEMSSTEHLIRLGLSANEAKALGALISLGPTGASDVHRHAGMPRNKAYESLEKLSRRGLVEVQQGRPTLYRAIGAKMVVDSLMEEYQREAKEVLSVLEKKEESQRGGGQEQDASAWMVRGERGVKRRLAELVYGAKTDIFSISGYPPNYMLSVKSALKAAEARGVRTRPVCMIRPTLDYEGLDLADSSSVIEYRTVKSLSALKSRAMDQYDERLVSGFSGMSGSGAMVIIDEAIAYDIVDEGKDPEKVAGILFKAPGVPMIQKATAERVLGLYTRKI